MFEGNMTFFVTKGTEMIGFYVYTITFTVIFSRLHTSKVSQYAFTFYTSNHLTHVSYSVDSGVKSETSMNLSKSLSAIAIECNLLQLQHVNSIEKFVDSCNIGFSREI